MVGNGVLGTRSGTIVLCSVQGCRTGCGTLPQQAFWNPTGTQPKTYNRRGVGTVSSLVGLPPRGVLNLNRGFVELGAYAINRLRRKPIIEFFAWNAPSTSKKERNDPGKPSRDPFRLARYYQSLLDTDKFESRAALARFLGVSRANVTQVLNRLKAASEPVLKTPKGCQGTSDSAG